MRLSLSLAALALGGAPLAAQTASAPPIELGVDAALTTDDITDATNVAIPLPRLRVGFFFSPTLSLEPTLQFNRSSGDGSSATGIDAALGLLAHVGGVPTGPARTASLFVRPFVGLTRVSFDVDEDSEDVEFSESSTQANAGVGLGVKLPVADRLAWRIEGVYARGFKNDDFPASNNFALTVGLSFHTR